MAAKGGGCQDDGEGQRREEGTATAGSAGVGVRWWSGGSAFGDAAPGRALRGKMTNLAGGMGLRAWTADGNLRQPCRWEGRRGRASLFARVRLGRGGRRATVAWVGLGRVRRAGHRRGLVAAGGYCIGHCAAARARTTTAATRRARAEVSSQERTIREETRSASRRGVGIAA